MINSIKQPWQDADFLKYIASNHFAEGRYLLQQMGGGGLNWCETQLNWSEISLGYQPGTVLECINTIKISFNKGTPFWLFLSL